MTPKLVRDLSLGASAVDVSCMHCGKRVRLNTCIMVLNGPAFEAYYCPPCAEVVFPNVTLPPVPHPNDRW